MSGTGNILLGYALPMLLFSAGLLVLCHIFAERRRIIMELPGLTASLWNSPWQPRDALAALLLITAAHMFSWTAATLISTVYGTDQVTAVIIQNIAFYLPMAAGIVKLSSGKSRPTALEKKTAAGISRILRCATAAYLAVIPPIMLYSAIYHTVSHTLDINTSRQPIISIMESSMDNPVSTVIISGIVVLIAPVTEEYIFRGIVFPAMLKSMDAYKAVITSSLLFAALHLHIGSFVPLFLLGIALCLVYIRTGSIMAPVLTHAIFNGITLSAVFLSR